MSFFSKLFPSLGKSPSKGMTGYTSQDGPHGIVIYLQCDKCNEKIAVRLRTTSEVQKRDGLDADLGPGQYFIQKTIVGSDCYNRIEATVDFDAKYNVVSSDIKHGKLITVADYKKDEQ